MVLNNRCPSQVLPMCWALLEACFVCLNSPNSHYNHMRYHHFTNGVIEAQRGLVSCPSSSSSQWVARMLTQASEYTSWPVAFVSQPRVLPTITDMGSWEWDRASDSDPKVASYRGHCPWACPRTEEKGTCPEKERWLEYKMVDSI